jgi:hypothetical protein
MEREYLLKVLRTVGSCLGANKLWHANMPNVRITAYDFAIVMELALRRMLPAGKLS